MKLSDTLRLEAAKRGIYLFRNNVGACQTLDGRFIRFGLANSSTKMNNTLKSADFIGFTPVVITEEMVGKTVAVFTSVEEKKYDRELHDSSSRLKAQRKWEALVRKNGGIAYITNDVDAFLNELYPYKII